MKRFSKYNYINKTMLNMLQRLEKLTLDKDEDRERIKVGITKSRLTGDVYCFELLFISESKRVEKDKLRCEDEIKNT